MNVTTTGYTIAEFCDQLAKESILVNHDYQRSPYVWPAAARSYLIDTILNGYPIPKIALFQKTDIQSRKTIKEIVDGQQRVAAIQAFFNNELRITGQSDFRGKRFDDLELDEKQAFIEYQLSADLFVGATEANIRQMFRRMNSYTVPLNPEEQRHATHQGAFKWFVVGLCEAHESALLDMSVLSKRQLARMQDAKLFTEIILALENGIQTYSKKKLDGLYSKYDEEMPGEESMRRMINGAIDVLLGIPELHGTAVLKPFNAYSLMLATIQATKPQRALRDLVRKPPKAVKLASAKKISQNLMLLNDAMESEDVEGLEKDLKAVYAASAGATNTKKTRETRFIWMYRAITNQL